MRIVLIGAPGSGKGTQARILMAEKQIPQISTGDMLREAGRAGTEFGLQAKAIIDQGEFVSDEIMLGVIRDRLLQSDAAEGFILDGYPRTLQQARDLDRLLQELGAPLDAAVLLDVGFEMLMKRLTGRRTCSKSGKLLNIYFSPQVEIDECLESGGELIQREDDNEETISHRLDVYHERTEPLIDFYRRRDMLKSVDAAGSIGEVYTRLVKALL